MLLDEEAVHSCPITGTVTLLFTNMEGSTRLLQQLGERYTTVLVDCQHLLRRAFAQHHGHEVDTQGRCLLRRFCTCLQCDGSGCDHSRPFDRPYVAGRRSVRVRIGLHTGEPLLTVDGYIGMDVHHAARISTLQGEYGQAQAHDLFQESRSSFEEAGDRAGMAEALM